MKFQIGDRVRILRKAKSLNRGWGNSWISSYMDRAVGRIGEVVNVLPDIKDVRLNVPGVRGSWGYPEFVLRKVRYRTVKKATKKKKRKQP